MKLIKYISPFLLALIFFVSFSQEVLAADCVNSPYNVQILDNSLGSDVIFRSNEITSLQVKLDVSGLQSKQADDQLEQYQLSVYDTVLDSSSAFVGRSDPFTVNESGTTTVNLTLKSSSIDPLQLLYPNSAFAFDKTLIGFNEDSKYVYIYQGEGDANVTSTNLCYLGEYRISRPNRYTCSEPVNVYQNRTISGAEKKCYVRNGTGCIDTQSPIFFEGSTIKDPNEELYAGPLVLDTIPAVTGIGEQAANPAGGFSTSLNIDTIGSYQFRVRIHPEGSAITNVEGACSETTFNVQKECPETECAANSSIPAMSSYELCDQILDETLQGKCRVCATTGKGGDIGQGGIWTAVGCISRDPVSIAKRLIQVGLGMGGGVALIMTLAGGFILSTSQGDPQKANQAKEMITNSVIGLLFVIFSGIILQFIGVTILRIPGFGANTEQTQ